MKLPLLNVETKEFNVADWISLYRIVASPILFAFIFLNGKFIFAILLAVSLFSDALDGFLARRLKITSARGAYLDSVGDVLTFIVALVGMIWFESAFVKEQIFLISITLFLYFLQPALGYWRYGKPSSFHTYSAKIAAVMLSIFFLYAFFFNVSHLLFYLTIIIGIFETLEESILIFLLPKWETDVKGLYWVLRRKK